MSDSETKLKTAYSFGDFLFYMCLLVVPVITAVMAIYRHAPIWILAYLICSVGGIALLLKFFCTRCPHYTCEGTTLKCIFFWGLPKFFTPRSGPYNKIDLLVTVLVTGAVVIFPLPWLLKEPGLLTIYALSAAGFGAAIHRNECERCINSACPMNRAEAPLNSPQAH